MINRVEFYKTKDYGELFRYFFELYAIAFTMGVATDEFEKSKENLPNISIDKNGELKIFLQECVSYLQEAYTPSVLDILMDRQYLECVSDDISKEQKSMLKLACRLIKGIHQFNIEVILDTKRLWNNDTVNYAEEKFYPKLPSDIREKYFL